MQPVQRRIVCLVFVALFLAVAPLALAFDTSDLNHDGEVDARDAGIFFQAWRHYRAQIPLTGLELNADVYPVGSPDGVIDRNDFRVFVEAFVQSYTPKINLADYMVFNVGDKRYWVDNDIIFQWRDEVALLAGQPDGVNEQHLPVLPVDEIHDHWLLQSGHIIAYGITIGGQTYTYATPMQLPDKLTQGVPVTVESDVRQGATNFGHVALTLTLLETGQTVAAPAHTFTGCAKVEVVRHGTINSVEYDDDSIYWLGPGMGWVQRDRDPAHPGTYMARVQKIKVGATEYGSVPSAAVAGLLPLPAGNMVILQQGDMTHGQSVLSSKTLSGQTVGVLAAFGLPVGDDAEYFTLAGGAASGLAGWKAWGDPYDYALSPVVSFGSTFTMGASVTVEDGKVKYNGNNSYADYQAVICPVGIEQTVNAAGTAFQHCVALDWHVGAVRPGHIEGLRQEDTRLWLAPGVGIVQMQGLDDIGNATGPVFPAVYAKSGATTYGTQPPMDLGNAMKLAAGNAWGLGYPSRDEWKVFSVEAAETVGSITGAVPLTEVRSNTYGGGQSLFAAMQSDYYYLTPTQMRLVGHRAEPDDFGGPITLIGSTATNNHARVLAMGDSSVTTGWMALVDSRTGLPVLVNGQQLSMRRTMCYAGRATSYNAILGTDFAGCDVVQAYQEFKRGSIPWGAPEIYTWLYDAQAGMVEYHQVRSGEGGEDWWLKWARVGARTWGGVESISFDIATYFPIAQGNTWRLGPTAPSTSYENWVVDSARTVGSYTNTFPVIMTPQGSTTPGKSYYQTDATTRRWVAEDFWASPTMGPYLTPLTPPVPEPRTWAMGAVVRTNLTFSVPAMGMTWSGTEAEVPVGFGMSVSTPAGTFNNCVATALISYGRDATGYAHWEHQYRIYAPDVGPAEYWARDADSPGGTIETSYSRFGQLQSATVGGVHYP
jgi:hypothetical protein